MISVITHTPPPLDLLRGPLLSQNGHPALDLVPVLLRLHVGAKPDAELFHSADRPAPDDGGAR